MENKYYYLIAGIVIGWITKTPWFLKKYREYNKSKKHIDEMFNKVYTEHENKLNQFNGFLNNLIANNHGKGFTEMIQKTFVETFNIKETK